MVQYIPLKLCVHVYILNLISNGLADKMVDELGLIFFSPNIITKESIGISMWKLNKLYDMSMQSVGDKENELSVQGYHLRNILIDFESFFYFLCHPQIVYEICTIV